jgi:hypothetical protein
MPTPAHDRRVADRSHAHRARPGRHHAAAPSRRRTAAAAKGASGGELSRVHARHRGRPRGTDPSHVRLR